VLLAIAATSIFFLAKRSPTVTYALVAGTVRAVEAPQTIRLPGSALRVVLDLHPNPHRFVDHAALRAVGSDEDLWNGPIAPKADHSVEILLPAATLAPGDYLLILQGREQPVESYYFRVLRP
jgi:hypothetical protein